ncbi:coniferyl alcohol acyltransferase-like [Miscanthus floridulus]|uniref:coniferyl alcohol acyltransferase-like n=1 Tax=Miscanthus floridulus TaxID=154761 RepID=UPI00345ACF98
MVFSILRRLPPNCQVRNASYDPMDPSPSKPPSVQAIALGPDHFCACAVVRSCIHRQKRIPLPPRSQPSFLPDGMPAERVDVAVSSRTLVRASDPPRGFPAVLQPSNLDLILGSFHIYLIAVYPAPAAGFPAVAAAARATLPAFLSRFFPFAGRIVANADTGVPEIACDNAGAELVVAHAGVRLADVDFADADRSLGRIAVPFQQGLALSLQLVRFACGGFAMSWATNHLLVDGHGLTALPNAWAELLRTGGLSWEPHHERASLFRPRDPPRYSPTLDAEFTRYAPGSLPNCLLTATLVRRNYVVSAADVDRLGAAASTPARRATRLESLSAHVWKLLAAAAGGLGDTRCRMAWLVDGRRRLDAARYDAGTVRRYLGNVVTYASREVDVEAVSSSPLADVAAMAGAAIAEVFRSERYEELVDWMEAHKRVFREGGKWTEVVGTGTGSPALVVLSFVPFHVEGDFGFGRPRLVIPWIRPGRLGSAAMTVARSPLEDGSWLITARLWPRLADAVDADPDAVLKPATAARLGFGAPDPADVMMQHTTTSRM